MSNLDKSKTNKTLGKAPTMSGHVYVGSTKKPENLQGTLKRLFIDIGTQKKILAWVLIVVLTGQVIVQLSTVFYGQAVRSVQNYTGDHEMISHMIQLIIFAGIAYLMTCVFQVIQQFLVIGVAQNTVFGIRLRLFTRIQKLSLRFFDTHENGDLMSRLSNDVETISDTLSNSLTSLIASIASIIFTASMMFYFSWRLALVSLVAVPILVVLTTQFSRITRKMFRKQQKALGDVNAHIEETVTGQKVVKVFVQEAQVKNEFSKTNHEYVDAALKAQITGGVLGPMMGLINNTTFLLIAFVGSIMVLNGQAEVWLLSQFFIYIRMLFRPLSELTQMMPQMQSAIAGAERVYYTMDEDDEIVDEDDAISVSKFDGDVVFRNVNFSYLQDSPVLKDVSIDVKRGQTIALVGPTGSGKTTIINLLTRFYDIQDGSIKIDGIDIKNIKKDDLRKQLAIVLQDVYLFAGTVKDNIRYGRLDATDEEVVEAAKKANAHQFIKRLTHGYDTILSEEGSNISQGQKQLLSISRAMLANPSILILDEATSSVDTRTEVHIQDAMIQLMKGKTSFVIAHRLSTIKSADVIMVINDGSVIEQGSHQQLLDMKGFYYNLYSSQYKQRCS